jgi:hypothetical protein
MASWSVKPTAHFRLLLSPDQASPPKKAATAPTAPASWLSVTNPCGRPTTFRHRMAGALAHRAGAQGVREGHAGTVLWLLAFADCMEDLRTEALRRMRETKADGKHPRSRLFRPTVLLLPVRVPVVSVAVLSIAYAPRAVDVAVLGAVAVAVAGPSAPIAAAVARAGTAEAVTNIS